MTVVDDGTIPHCRGSLTIDDEGTPSGYNVLIEDGKLVGFMQDRLNARLMGSKSTGNGRRESYAYAPMPRMTNTIMLGGDKTPEEIISSLKVVSMLFHLAEDKWILLLENSSLNVLKHTA